jgi:glycosyltransferase involved in cell wall biosynthesis
MADVTFLLVGGEPADVSQVRNKIQQRGLTNVRLTGFVPNAKLPKYQAACNVLLMPYQQSVSASSGGDIAKYLSPMKLFEYMASARVILSSNLPVLQEVLNEKNAMLLPPDHPTAWIEGITAIRNTPDRFNHLSNQAKSDVLSYSWEARAQKILSVRHAR